MTASHAPREALATPPLCEFVAPAAWHSIDFISDLHLQASHPATVDAFAAHLQTTPADAVFILGDLFESWVGDDARHCAFESQVAAILRATSSQRGLAFMAGNRDFLLGPEFLQECGMTALADPTVLLAFDERLLLTHGDALCLDDTAYQRFRREVRAPHWRRSFLALPLAQRRAMAAHMREASSEHQRAQPAEAWADVDARAAVQWMSAAATPLMVHGHTHRPGTGQLAPGFTRVVLTDWELERTPPRCGVLRLSGRGLERVAPSGPAAAAAPP